MVSETTIRVRYAETDTMGVVYYGNYLTYFEVGRVEFLRQSGFSMSTVDRKVHMPVVEASVRYVKPVPSETPLLGRARAVDNGRHADAEGSLEVLATGEIVATARGRFVHVPRPRAATDGGQAGTLS